jgi:hypothetical protein
VGRHDRGPADLQQLRHGAAAGQLVAGALQVHDADASLERARRLGTTILMGPNDIAAAGRFGVLADPTGAVLAAPVDGGVRAAGSGGGADSMKRTASPSRAAVTGVGVPLFLGLLVSWGAVLGRLELAADGFDALAQVGECFVGL